MPLLFLDDDCLSMLAENFLTHPSTLSATCQGPEERAGLALPATLHVDVSVTSFYFFFIVLLCMDAQGAYELHLTVVVPLYLQTGCNNMFN